MRVPTPLLKSTGLIRIESSGASVDASGGTSCSSNASARPRTARPHSGPAPAARTSYLRALMSSLEKSIPVSENRASTWSPARYPETSRSCNPRNAPLRPCPDPTLPKTQRLRNRDGRNWACGQHRQHGRRGEGRSCLDRVTADAHVCRVTPACFGRTENRSPVPRFCGRD